MFKAVEDFHVAGVASRSGGEDRALLAAAAAIGRELEQPSRVIYWTDLLITAIVAHASFASALFLPLGFGKVALAVVAMLAFYRGLSFIHELTHVRRAHLPGFAPAWNLLFGVPLLTPSFLYDDVHVLHHARTSYGTDRDPEYLPAGFKRPHKLLLFVAAAALAPIGLLVRFAVLAPLSVAAPRLRRLVVERYSALAINPKFRRRTPSGAFRREWCLLEAGTTAWALAILVMLGTGVIGPSSFGLGIAVGAGLAVINQVRTLVAHLWDNEAGAPMSLTAQYLDSVNVPPPALLPALWAPVGLRYHALHHLLPSVPYHALGTARRRLIGRLGAGSQATIVDYRNIGRALRAVIGG